MVLQQNEVEYIASLQSAGKIQQLTVEISQPAYYLLGVVKGDVLNLPAGARKKPDSRLDRLTTSERWIELCDRVIVRELTALEKPRYGARNSSQEIAASTWIGASASQLLESGCHPTGVELPLRNDKFTLANNYAETNAGSSISVSVHGPVVAGPKKRGTAYDSSSHLSDDQFMSITDTETKRFQDAGDMRGETEGSCSNVNSYLTETNEAPEAMNSKGSQSSEMHRLSTSAQLDGSNDQRTIGIRIDGSGRASIPYC